MGWLIKGLVLVVFAIFILNLMAKREKNSLPVLKPTLNSNAPKTNIALITLTRILNNASKAITVRTNKENSAEPMDWIPTGLVHALSHFGNKTAKACSQPPGQYITY